MRFIEVWEGQALRDLYQHSSLRRNETCDRTQQCGLRVGGFLNPAQGNGVTDSPGVSGTREECRKDKRESESRKLVEGLCLSCEEGCGDCRVRHVSKYPNVCLS